MPSFLSLIPDLIRVLAKAFRAARQPDIHYSREQYTRKWIATYQGHVFIADTRPEAAQGVLRLAARDE